MVGGYHHVARRGGRGFCCFVDGGFGIELTFDHHGNPLFRALGRALAGVCFVGGVGGGVECGGGDG